MRDITDIRVDRQRERKMVAVMRVALGKHDDVADMLALGMGRLLVTLKSGEKFEIAVDARPTSRQQGEKT